MRMMFDIHAHIHGTEFDANRNEIVNRAVEKNIGIITVGTDYEESARAVACAEKYENVFATVGIHPVDKILSFEKDVLTAIARHPKVVAIGECGLDYYWPAHHEWIDGDIQEKTRQKELFERQIELAIELDLPLMIHGRPTKKSMDAYEDILTILKKYKNIHDIKVRGNVHFFVGSLTIAEQFWGLGFTTSFTGVITFTHEYDEVVRTAPLSMLMAETDSPYATPVPYRGTKNEPVYVEKVYERIAEIRNVSVQDIIDILDHNRKRIFNV